MIGEIDARRADRIVDAIEFKGARGVLAHRDRHVERGRIGRLGVARRHPLLPLTGGVGLHRRQRVGVEFGQHLVRKRQDRRETVVVDEDRLVLDDDAEETFAGDVLGREDRRDAGVSFRPGRVEACDGGMGMGWVKILPSRLIIITTITITTTINDNIVVIVIYFHYYLLVTYYFR